MRKLYHGTLAKNLPRIKQTGLLPKKGLWAEKFHADASKLVYAVDETRKARLITIITGQMLKSNLLRWSNDYQFEDFKNDLIGHGAVVVFQTTTFCYRPDFDEPGHPPGVEPGDWYSRESVGIENILRVMSGPEMLDWLKPCDTDFAYRYRDLLRTCCS